MKKICLALLATSFVFADEGEEIAAAKKQPVQQQPVAEQNPFIEYNNRIAVFNPFHQVYERTKPHAYYVGVEAWLTYAWSNQNNNDNNNTCVLGEAELRMGYNFFYNGKDHVTPFAGVGAVRDYKSEHWNNFVIINGGIFTDHVSVKKPAVLYGVLGFLYDHEFNRWFTVGSNFKFLIGGSSSSKHVEWGNPVTGLDIAIPITFRFGYKRHWDFRIEPFDIYLNGQNFSRNYLGFRSTLGYRF
jgi:hypothetical protein